MKVLAVNSSPRHNGNTSLLIKEVLQELEKERIQTEIKNIGGKNFFGCKACMWCGGAGKGQNRCITDDGMNEIIELMIKADGIILASPTYFGDITPELKCLIDRAGYVTRKNGGLLDRKVGAGVISVRRAAGMHAFQTINSFFLINSLIVPGSSYWNIGIGREIGEVLKDEEGIMTMRNLGKNMAWLLKKINN